eukprot:Em0012g104a
MANVWILSAAALVVHSILFISIFDIYFTSPVETGLKPQRYSMKPPAERLVLFVADGLRADTVFSVGKTYVPYLREIVETRGRWGVSHTHVPTESRPGHVAIIAGLYEDVSAVTRGWRENPVHFDSVFNQSAHTWAWGSPDILPMFRAGAVPGRVETFTYDHQLEDFAGENPAYLDTWVFERVQEFFAMAKENATHARLLSEGKIVFFLHLLGLDTNGHSHKPDSREVFNNLLLVDRGVRQVVELFESHYRDNATAYVFTSDHGMTDWGSHGAGLPHETMTPLICWGAGIKSPKSSLNSHFVYHDGYSEAWNLGRYERLDVEQVDLAPLMSSLIGLAIPVNSEGVLPLHYIHYNQLFLAESLYANARQLMEQVRVKAERTSNNSLPFLFRPFSGLLPSELSKRTEEIETLINAHHIQRAVDLSRSLITLCKEGIRYYHTYHRLPLKVAITVGFIGWLACVVLAILEDHTQYGTFIGHHGEGLFGAHQKATLVLVTLVVAVGMVLWYQSSPLLHYLYYTLPLFCWFYVWTRRQTFRTNWLRVATNHALIKGVVVLVAVVVGLEALVVSFFHREMLSALLVVVSLWPCLTTSPFSRPWLCAAWTLLCLALAVFPLLPVTDRGTNLVLASAPGLSLSLVGALLLAHPTTRIMLVSPGGPHRHTLLLWLQVTLLGVASLIPAVTHWFFRRKESIPLVVHGFSWCTLLVSTFTPLTGPVRVLGRLGHTLLCLFTIFTLMSTSYEAMFVLLLFTSLLVWLQLEEVEHHSTTQKPGSMWSSDVTFRTPRLLTVFPGDSCHDDGGSASLGDVRRAWLCLFLGILSFFGTGNVASINTFNPNMIYPFITVFSPFVMGALLVLKMAVPFVFVSSVFNVILSLLHIRLKTILFLMLVMSDLMGLNFFFLVRDSGSWLEIGVSISHYIIMMTMAVAVVLLMGVARLLTGIAVVPSKSHSY